MTVLDIALNLAWKTAGAFSQPAIEARISAGLNPGDKLVLGRQSITFLGNGMARSEKDGKTIREGAMSAQELENLLAAIAAQAGRKSL